MLNDALETDVTVGMESRSKQINLMIASGSFSSFRMPLALHVSTTGSRMMRYCTTEPANEAYGRDAHSVQVSSPASLRYAIISVWLQGRS